MEAEPDSVLNTLYPAPSMLSLQSTVDGGSSKHVEVKEVVVVYCMYSHVYSHEMIVYFA